MSKPGNIKRILVVGSWAKEEITIENIKENPKFQLFCYLDTHNPGIEQRVDDSRVGSLEDVENILDYASEMKADLTLVTTAAPLAAGLTDRMLEEGMTVFGPTKEAARLESDKALARQLMKKYVPAAIPRFKVCRTVDEALDFARQLDWKVAIKPVGLTDGLGVKVFGVQLADIKAVEEYIEEIHERKISGNSRIIVEERMAGEEFTIQCFVHENTFIPTPAVQDFKKLLNHDKGPNTASMGSYADRGQLLPFMNQKDYQQAVQTIKKTISAFKKETGQWCNGFLYGQFMSCRNGIKLVEYNFRPGDPEWLNTVAILDYNIADIVGSLLREENPAVTFKREATVCKYIVPPDYPYKMNEPLEVSLDWSEMKKRGVDVYWSCGVEDDGTLRVGSERGIALLAKGDTIFQAHRKIEAAISDGVKGKYRYRSDIGTRQMIRSKVETVGQMKKADIRFRKARQEDFLSVYDFVSGCPPLESYPEHVYKILLRYFGDCCFIAEFRDRIVGFVLGFIPQNHSPRTYFLWQIGVSPLIQESGLGRRLLEKVEEGVTELGCRRIEVTIDPHNIPSQKLFDKMGYGNISQRAGKTVKVRSQPAVKDYYKPGRHFMLYEKILPDTEKNPIPGGQNRQNGG